MTVSSDKSRVLAKAFEPSLIIKIFTLLWVLILAFWGGASRADEPAQIVVRIFSILLLVFCWPTAFNNPRPGLRPIALLLLSAAILIAVQLIPLPPSTWAAFPGRSIYLEAANALGMPQPWRPLNLVPAQGWNALLALLPGVTALVAFIAVGRTGRPSSLLVVLVLGLLSALFGLAQLTDAVGPAPAYRVSVLSQPAGLFANRNHQALLLALTLPVLAIWSSDRAARGRGVSRLDALLIAVFAVVIMVASLATGSRSGFGLLAVAVIGSIALVHEVVPFRAASRRPKLTVVAGISVLALVIGVAATRSASISRVFTINIMNDQRNANLPTLWQMAREFFPVGSGYGSFDPVFRRFESFSSLNFNYFNQAHSDPLQVIIEGGAPGLLLIVVYVCLWCRWSWQAWFDRGRSRDIARLGSVVTLAFMLASIVDYPLRTPILSSIFVLANAWLLSSRSPQRRPDSQRSSTIENSEREQ